MIVSLPISTSVFVRSRNRTRHGNKIPPVECEESTLLAWSCPPRDALALNMMRLNTAGHACDVLQNFAESKYVRTQKERKVATKNK